MIENLAKEYKVESLAPPEYKNLVGSQIGHSEDDNIYRIVPFTQFLSMLVNDENTLVHPSCWEDPFEKQLNNFLVKTKEGNNESHTEFEANRWYAQCWSFKDNNDGLWRSFTNNKSVRSVKIQTTIRQLLDSWKPSKSSKTELYLCNVYYSPEADYYKNVTALAREYQIHLYKGMEPDSEADEIQFVNELSLLTLKRDAFIHESECRLLAYRPRNYKKSSWSYKTNVNQLISSVVFDPWTKDYEYDYLKKVLKEKMGYSGEIKPSLLYEDLKRPRTLTIERIQHNGF